MSGRYEATQDYYVMEFLDPAERGSGLLREMHHVLTTGVWSRPKYASPAPDVWPRALLERYGARVPPVTDGTCLTHGDCTVANAMRREDGTLVLADPVWFRHFAPSWPQVDRGKLLQSAAGWEAVTEGSEFVFYDPVDAMCDPEVWEPAVYWCAINMLRIRYREVRAAEPRLHVLGWAEHVLEVCAEHVGVWW